MKLKIKDIATNEITITDISTSLLWREGIITDEIKDLLNKDLEVIEGKEIILEIEDWEENYPSVNLTHQVVIKSWTKEEQRAVFKWYLNLEREDKELEILNRKLSWKPYTIKQGLDYLKWLYEYLVIHNQEITLSQLNALSGIAEITEFVDIFNWRKEDYLQIGYIDIRNFIIEFQEYVEKFIAENPDLSWE